MQGFIVCARMHDSSVLMFVHGVPRVLCSSELRWGEPREVSGTIRDCSVECCQLYGHCSAHLAQSI